MTSEEEEPTQASSLEEIISSISSIIADQKAAGAPRAALLTCSTTGSALAPVVSSARWPLVVAPMVGLVYYLAFWSAFVTAMGDVVVLSTSELDQSRGGAVVWGTHWIYRLVAEGISIAFGTFVAGGMARERATIAGLIGGFGISLFWTAAAAFVLFVYINLPGSVLLDPWYQYVIGACVIFAAPVVGYQLGRTSGDISTGKPTGFAGIPRAHFLWLWFPTYWYAAALIGPFLKFYSNGLIQWTPAFLALALYFIPLVCFVAPLLYGVALISDESSRMRPAFRQALGAFVLIVGWGVAAAIQYGVIVLVNWL